MAKQLISVAICTWNRAKLLDQTLVEMEKLRIPDGIEWELLVVNNNSPDNTDEVIARHTATGRLPVRRLFEPKQGHVHARNCAVAAARGELIVWTDDDVLVGGDWLAEYVSAASRYPNAAYFGGPIRPWFVAPPPRWMRNNLPVLGHNWALLDKITESRELMGGEEVYGANMAYRAAIMRRYPFDPNTGHVGATFRGGDETSLQSQIRAEGNLGVWVLSAAVRHFIPPARMTLDYVWNLQKALGESWYDAAECEQHPKIASVPRWIWRDFIATRLRVAVLAPFRRQSWAKAFVRCANLRGMIAAARKSARQVTNEPESSQPCSNSSGSAGR